MIDDDVPLAYESGPVYVVVKPTGLLTQAPPGIDSLEVRVKEWIRRRENKTGNVYLGVPHRLDRPVSGALVLARHARAARRLSEQFESRLVKNTYWACVSGVVTPAAGTWTDFLYKVPGEPRAQIAEADNPLAREAILHYRVLAAHDWGTWLEIELETGRTHQIRVQAASRGHPVLGDQFYRSVATFGPAFDDERLRSIALHGRSITFRHPMTQEMVSVAAPPPKPWHKLGLAIDDTPSPVG